MNSAAAVTFSRLRRSCVDFVQGTGLAHLDGRVQQFETTKNIVFQLCAQMLLNGIVFGEVANEDELLVSVAFRGLVGSQARRVTRIQETGALAGGDGECGLKVAERQLNVVTMSDPSVGMQKTNDGDRGGDSAGHEKNQRGDEGEACFFSR